MVHYVHPFEHEMHILFESITNPGEHAVHYKFSPFAEHAEQFLLFYVAQVKQD